MSNYKSKLLFNLTPAIREKEGSPQCGHEGFFLLLQKLVLLLQVADLGIFQQTLQLSLNLPLNISPWDDKDEENEHGDEKCICLFDTRYLCIYLISHRLKFAFKLFSFPQLFSQLTHLRKILNEIKNSIKLKSQEGG